MKSTLQTGKKVEEYLKLSFRSNKRQKAWRNELSKSRGNILKTVLPNIPNVPLSEIFALSAIYFSLQGEGWYLSQPLVGVTFSIGYSWHFPKNLIDSAMNTITSWPNPCTEQWHGIVCTCNITLCHITTLQFELYNLKGTLPEAIGNLIEVLIQHSYYYLNFVIFHSYFTIVAISDNFIRKSINWKSSSFFIHQMF